MKRARTGFLCAKRASTARKNKGLPKGGGGGTYPKGAGHPKGRTGPPFHEHDPEGDPDSASATGPSAEDIIIYEEVQTVQNFIPRLPSTDHVVQGKV